MIKVSTMHIEVLLEWAQQWGFYQMPRKHGPRDAKSLLMHDLEKSFYSDLNDSLWNVPIKWAHSYYVVQCVSNQNGETFL